jgi:hypothetical protein
MERATTKTGVRSGPALEYARFQQTYANNQAVFNNRWQFCAFYIF